MGHSRHRGCNVRDNCYGGGICSQLQEDGFMPSISERLLPELRLFDRGPERQRMLLLAVNGPRTIAAAFLSVLGATGLFILWDKLVASVPSQWSLHLLTAVLLLVVGIAIWYTRQDIRCRLRAQLATKGIPICIPCGYDLTGNVTGVCSECGKKIEHTH